MKLVFTGLLLIFVNCRIEASLLSGELVLLKLLGKPSLLQSTRVGIISCLKDDTSSKDNPALPVWIDSVSPLENVLLIYKWVVEKKCCLNVNLVCCVTALFL